MCDRASKVAKRKECSFVFDKLLTLEAEYPVTNFVATDGSKDIDAETGAIRVGRACLAVELGARVLRLGRTARRIRRHLRASLL